MFSVLFTLRGRDRHFSYFFPFSCHLYSIQDSHYPLWKVLSLFFSKKAGSLQLLPLAAMAGSQVFYILQTGVQLEIDYFLENRDKYLKHYFCHQIECCENCKIIWLLIYIGAIVTWATGPWDGLFFCPAPKSSLLNNFTK